MSGIPLRSIFLALLATGVVVAGGTMLLGPPESGYYISATAVDDPGDGTVYDIEDLEVDEREIVRQAIESEDRPFTSSPPSDAVGKNVRHEGTVYEIMATGQFGPSEPIYVVPLLGGSLLAICGAVGLTVSIAIERRRCRS